MNFIFILNHTKVPTIVTMKERESDASDTLRNAKYPYMTNVGYVAEQCPRTV